MHSWGDSWPYWSELYKAELYIKKMYHRLTKKHVISKEKYGTLRFELTEVWITSKKEFKIFAAIIKKAIKKFNNVSAEIVSDLISVFPSEYDNGWIAGVLYASGRGTEWFHVYTKSKDPVFFKKTFE